jgi:hypothetical protein
MRETPPNSSSIRAMLVATSCQRSAACTRQFIRQDSDSSFAKPYAVSAKPIIRIDGLQFSTLEGFFEHFAARALGGSPWGRHPSLDGFNDVLRGGFGTPEGGFRLEWLNHAASKERLGYLETVRQLQSIAESCHPSNVGRVNEELAAARREEGSTVYEWLLDIIQTHGPGGEEEEDGVELVLL